MEPINDKELLELQKLCLEKGLYSPRTSLEQKKQVLRLYYKEKVPISTLSTKFNVNRRTIYRWISKFADGKMLESNMHLSESVNQNPSPMSKKKENPAENPDEELARLREENERLKEALKMAEWSNHAKDVMIDLAEKTFNIPIRKKSGAKQ